MNSSRAFGNNEKRTRKLNDADNYKKQQSDQYKRRVDPEVHNNYCSQKFNNYVDYAPTEYDPPAAKVVQKNSPTRYSNPHNSVGSAGYNIITGK